MQINRSISYTKSWKSTIYIACIVAAVFCFVLIFLQPFDTYNVDMPYKNMKLLGYALPIIFSILIIHILENLWYKRQQKWLLWNEFLVLMLGLLLITFLSFIYLNNLVNPESLPWSEYFIWMQGYGLPFAPIMLALWGYLRFRFSYIEINEQQNTSITYTITGNNTNETYTIEWNEFILASAQSNYVEIVTIDTSHSKNKILLRSSLSKLSRQLPKAVQVHRSHLINTEHLLKLEGNSRKGWCHLKGIDITIPVSPKHFKGLKHWFQSRPK